MERVKNRERREECSFELKKIKSFVQEHSLANARVSHRWEEISASFERALFFLSQEGEDFFVCKEKAEQLFLDLADRFANASPVKHEAWSNRARLLLGSLDERQYEGAYFFNEPEKKKVPLGERIENIAKDVRTYLYNSIHENTSRKFVREMDQEQWNEEVDHVVYPQKEDQKKRREAGVCALGEMLEIVNDELANALFEKNEEEVFRLFKEINSLKVELLVQKALLRKKIYADEGEKEVREKVLEKEGMRRVLLRQKLEEHSVSFPNQEPVDDELSFRPKKRKSE
jgi:hypothetical protein